MLKLLRFRTSKTRVARTGTTYWSVMKTNSMVFFFIVNLRTVFRGYIRIYRQTHTNLKMVRSNRPKQFGSILLGAMFEVELGCIPKLSEIQGRII